MPTPHFVPGNNIALKVPPHEFDATVAFYRDVLGFPLLEKDGESVGIDFNGKNLWIDRVETVSHAEVWLEICADDIPAAEAYFEEKGVTRRDEIETLPEDFTGFWIATPSNLIHLVTERPS